MQPRAVRVDATADNFTALFEASRSASVRIGWLDLTTAPEPPAGLATAAAGGALRAVSVVGRQVVSVKAMGGEPVLRDVVREHFTGCRLLLVRGELDAPTLVPNSGAWILRRLDGVEKTFSTAELLAALRSPSFP